jgi:hypothetical protein
MTACYNGLAALALLCFFGAWFYRSLDKSFRSDATDSYARLVILLRGLFPWLGAISLVAAAMCFVMSHA